MLHVRGGRVMEVLILQKYIYITASAVGCDHGVEPSEDTNSCLVM